MGDMVTLWLALPPSLTGFSGFMCGRLSEKTAIGS